MNQTVKTSAENLIGTVAAPPSKSAAHRAIICAALAKGSSCIHNISSSKDILATCKVLTALGAQIQEGEGSCLHVDGSGMFTGEAALCDCNESGSTLRFLIPVAAAGGVPATFTGSGRLPERPIGLYTELLPKHGAECLSSGGLPLRVNGKLQAGVYELAGNISSQFITGLMLALPLLEGESQIKLTTPLESRGYVDLTLEILGEFGIDIQ
ncbi:MAG: 3-phosphoshikimate 1-carboxyvinyltransferase, partial [Oscillospiraceae bacterium]|nr:3-phosphoshikimate 1-carboxyvinyltransferase [Oscillospiraceae bacterium]